MDVDDCMNGQRPTSITYIGDQGIILHTEVEDELVEEVVELAEVSEVEVGVAVTVTGAGVSVTVAGYECTSQNRANKARLKAQNNDREFIYGEK